MLHTIGETLASYREEMKMSQSELAARLRQVGVNVTNQAVSKWENGTRQPSAEQFLALCSVLQISNIESVFSDGLTDYGRLNTVGQRKVNEYAHILALSGLYERERKVIPMRKLPVYSVAASAGTGQFLDSSDYELMEVGDEVPMSANFGITIAGDSMEPRFENGQIVWVQQQLTLKDGEIGIFLYDGNAYCKVLSAASGRVRLISLNPKYKPIEVDSDYLELRVLGKVVS